MVFVMDKMKDHFCAIQPAFGIGGGGGFNGLNFALMLDQVFNPDNFLPIDEDDVQLDAVINFPPFNQTNFPPFSPTNFPPFEGLNFNPITPAQLQPLVTEQSNQEPGTQQPQPTVAELVTNAIHHHIATHHALMNNASGTAAGGANNAHQPPLSISEMMQNALQEQLSPPPVHIPSIPGIPNIPGVVAHSIQYQVLSDTPGSLPVSVSADQPQLLISLPSNNGFGMQQYVIGPGQSPPINMGDFSLDIHFSTTNSDIQQPSTPESLPNLVLLNDVQETVPADEDSNSSVPPIQAPFSSPAYPFSPSESNASHEYGPSVASNIVIIDSAESPVDDDENQSNHTDVPN